MTHPNPASENDDLEWASVRHQNPDRFWEGYQHGLIGKSASMEVYAVLVEGVDDMPKGLRVTAHVSGNSIDVLHCPFCGSGAVIARSDGTIECGYCMSVFTVQVQPQFSGFPQSVDGQPYQWPGMPDPNAVMAPDTPPGTNVNPMVAPDSSDPSAFDGVDGDEDDDDDDGNPFASDSDSDADADSDDGSSKSKPQSKSDDKSDKKSDKKKSDKGNPFGKKSSSLRTAQGAELPVAEFEAHLAIKYAKNPLIVAQRVREGRAGGLL